MPYLKSQSGDGMPDAGHALHVGGTWFEPSRVPPRLEPVPRERWGDKGWATGRRGDRETERPAGAAASVSERETRRFEETALGDPGGVGEPQFVSTCCGA
jgi:hypothetical protein